MKLIVIAALAVPIVLAQKKTAAAEEKSGPVHVKRRPPSPDPNDGEALETPNQLRRRLPAEAAAVPSPEEYPLTEALKALQAAEPKVPGQRLTFSPLQTKKAEAPKDYRPKTTTPPSATANDALTMSDRW